MKNVKDAVILVAGEGKRLRPFTDTNPKCFAAVHGRTILENSLEALAANGCERVRIVVGHLGQKIEAAITTKHRGMDIQFIHNEAYQSTNSMFSLALGLRGLAHPSWVLEGDVFFDKTILDLQAPGDLCWFVDSTSRQMDGAYVEMDPSGRALSLNIVRDLSLLQPNQHKSIGILQLSVHGMDKLLEWLEDGIRAGKENVYYDLILADHMNDLPIRVVDIKGAKWFEIDSQADLIAAEKVFS